MVFMINGIDFSPYLYRYGLAIQYSKVYGDNGGVLVDGTEVVDLVKVRTILTAACNPLTSERLSKLADVCREEYVVVDFEDPNGGRQRKEMIPDLSAANKSLTVGGITYWEGLVITLRER